MDFLEELLTYECPFTGVKRVAGCYGTHDQERTKFPISISILLAVDIFVVKTLKALQKG